MNLSYKGSRSSNAMLTVSEPWCNMNDAALLGVFKLGEGKIWHSTRAWLNYSKRERSMQFPHRSNFCTQHGGPDTFNARHHGKYLWQIRDLNQLQIAERSTTCGMCSWAIVQIKPYIFFRNYYFSLKMIAAGLAKPIWLPNFFSFYIFQVHRVFNWKLQSCYAYKP